MPGTNDIRLFVAPFVSLGRKEGKRAVTFSSASHGSSVFPAAGVKLDADASDLRTSYGFLLSPNAFNVVTKTPSSE